MWFRIASVFLLGLSSVSTASAAIVNLSLQSDPGASTFSVFGLISGASSGLASFDLDVVGSNGLTIATSLNASPLAFTPPSTITGFKLFRTEGTAGIDIRASQDTISAPSTLILNLGVGTPVLLATGTYSGLSGMLTAMLHPGNTFNLLPAGYAFGGPTEAATAVNSASITIAAVPEPSMCVVCGLAFAIGWGFRRRRHA